MRTGHITAISSSIFSMAGSLGITSRTNTSLIHYRPPTLISDLFYLAGVLPDHYRSHSALCYYMCHNYAKKVMLDITGHKAWKLIDHYYIERPCDEVQYYNPASLPSQVQRPCPVWLHCPHQLRILQVYVSHETYGPVPR